MTSVRAGRALVIRGDGLRLPLADETVDLVVASPPFYGQRDYGTGHPAEIGSEASPAEFLHALWAATAEIKRVLKPSGSAFINLGDAYARPGGGADISPRTLPGAGAGAMKRLRSPNPGRVREKSLLLLPEAYRLGCTGMLAALGGPDPGLNLIARAVIVQSKLNSLPESVTDRVRRSHEDWVHLVKSPRYYSAVDELREPYDAPHATRTLGPSMNAGVRITKPLGTRMDAAVSMNPLGKLPGSVWPVASEPLDLPDYLVRLPTGVTMLDAGPLWRHVEWMRATGQPGPVIVRELDHYAAFASELPRRFILGWSPPGICVDCGHGRFPVVNRPPTGGFVPDPSDKTAGASANGAERNRRYREQLASGERATILGYACACCPSTWHEATGGSSGIKYVTALNSGDGYPPNYGAGTGTHDNLSARPRTGPWREYHLDRWTPPPTRPAVVLDPFGGVGTTAAVAVALGRTAVTVDLRHDYSLAAWWRVRHSPVLAKTARRTNNDAQARAVDPGPPVPVPPKPPTLTYRDPAAERANRGQQGTLL